VIVEDAPFKGVVSCFEFEDPTCFCFSRYAVVFAGNSQNAVATFHRKEYTSLLLVGVELCGTANNV
jgi:hypothetical protein